MTVRQAQQIIVVTRDPAATRALGAALATAARSGDLISLVGDLGAGKTQLAKGFGAGLGVTDTIVSPSFVLMAEYRGRLPLFHIDLYRLADAAEAMAGGLVDERQSEGVTLIEWAERLADAMPAGRLDVLIDGTGDDPRTIRLVTEDGNYTRYLEAAETADLAYPDRPDAGAADAQRVATRLSAAAGATVAGRAETEGGAADAQRVATRLSGAADGAAPGRRDAGRAEAPAGAEAATNPAGEADR